MKKKPAALPHDDEKIKKLIEELARAETAVQAYFDNQVDAILDPMKGSLILLRQAQDALVEEVRYHHMANILQNVPDAIIVADLEGKITYWNDGASALHGHGPEAMLGRSLSDLNGASQGGSFEADLKAILEGKEYRLEWERKNEAGASIWIESRMSPMRDAEGNPTGFMRVEKDVTQRKGAEEQLRQAQKLEALGTLAGGIAHDFNNILATVITNSELALFDLPAGSPLRPGLEAVLTAGIRGRDLVRQILSFSRKSNTQQKRVNLTAIITETYKFLRSSLPATINMDVRLDTDPRFVDADPIQIQQIIANLCTNSAYAMRERGGRIEISAQATRFNSQEGLPDEQMTPGEYVALSVKDTGCGMDEETRNKIFEPFFSTKPPGEGTGLGLSIVYGIVKSHRGAVCVQSEVGKGSTFTVYLPRAGAAAQMSDNRGEDIPRGKERVLLVDDDEMIVNAVSRMMRTLGYQVTAVTDSREALSLFSKEPSRFDLVVSDQTMPSMAGEELAREMLRLRPDIPIILCTGHSDSMSSEKAATMGIRGFIMKPFTVREGAKLMRSVLDQKESGNP